MKRLVLLLALIACKQRGPQTWFGIPKGVGVTCEYADYHRARKCPGSDGVLYTCVPGKTQAGERAMFCARAVAP